MSLTLSESFRFLSVAFGFFRLLSIAIVLSTGLDRLQLPSIDCSYLRPLVIANRLPLSLPLSTQAAMVATMAATTEDVNFDVLSRPTQPNHPIEHHLRLCN